MAESLGRLTAAAVRTNGDAIRLIARATGLSESRIRTRLADVHGKTLVCNAFKGHWPATPSMLASVNAKLARDCALFNEIAAITRLSERTVVKRIQEAHGRRTLRRLFDYEWPADDAATDTSEGRQSNQAFTDAGEDARGDTTNDHQIETKSIVDTLHVSTNWSPPRRLARIFLLSGMVVPQRLRAARFHELLERLQRDGVEMKLADAPGLLSSESASPGIHAQVQIRTIAFADRSNSANNTPSPAIAQFDPTKVQEAADLATSIVDVGLLVSKIDRIQHPLEIEKIRARAQRDSSTLTPTARERLFRRFDLEISNVDIEQAAGSISARLDLPERSNVFEHLFDIAAADGVIVAEEIQILRRLESALKPRPGLLEELLRRHNDTQTQADVFKGEIGRAHFRSAHRVGSITDAGTGSRDPKPDVDEIMDLLFSR